MALPKQVQAQIAQVEELERQLAAEQAPPEQPAQTEADPEQTPAPAAEAAPTQPTEARVSEETWEQKYKTLMGMYNAEVPRLHQQVKELSQAMQQLQQAQPAVQPAAQETAKPGKLVTDDDVEKFGSDLIEVQRRVAMEVAAEFQAKIEALQQQNAAMQERLMLTGNQVSNLTFEQQLSLAVPTFAQVNADPRWVAWLNEVDPMLRAPRRVAAQTAFDSGDVAAIAHYVQLFEQTVSAQPKGNRQAELERQVTPSRGATHGQTTSGAEKKLYSTAEAEAVFTRVRILNMQQKFDEAAKLEAEISAAYAEGRVR